MKKREPIVNNNSIARYILSLYGFITVLKQSHVRIIMDTDAIILSHSY